MFENMKNHFQCAETKNKNKNRIFGKRIFFVRA